MNFNKLFGLMLVVMLLGFVPMTAKAEESAKESAEPTVHFVELNPLVLPVINERGASQIVSLVVAVEVDSQEKADKVTLYSPRLTDAFLSDLYGTFAHKKPENGVIPIDYLKQRLNQVSAKVLGDGVVDDVLLQVLQRRSS